jgi:hypothetical protein
VGPAAQHGRNTRELLQTGCMTQAKIRDLFQVIKKLHTVGTVCIAPRHTSEYTEEVRVGCEDDCAHCMRDLTKTIMK